ncbi:MAG: hypothetical protein AVDCRST_MAG68-2075 [uncultured Gemmatimonadetes bacterium]|uniref:Uncharacterized protein n=1 Tax=uncultured Gemmatimonadota bacterium TaxID=203437 RepID=A0A6J4L4W2_9BACT|nr:MAG: hypothetical protein AVDCRST_MAG68-2075 [uncultured Gemmatimonadota bacterium]
MRATMLATLAYALALPTSTQARDACQTTSLPQARH